LPLDVRKTREDFPALHQQVYGHDLVYLDNAATTLKPRAVMDKICTYYSTINSNVHRGVHYLSQQATEEFESTRRAIAGHLHAAHPHEIIFTKGATESINLVASSFGKKFVGEGDEVVISALEHHANIVPWQVLCEDRKARLKIIPADEAGTLDLDAYGKLLSPRTRIVAITHVSNALGTIVPVKEVIRMAHGAGVPVLVDGAQAAPHFRIDVRDLDCDFYCYSGHKCFGPMGMGILYGKEKWLEQMPPYQTGGEMISTVTFEKTTFNELPYKFEAGTPNVADVCGFRATLEYIATLGFDNIHAWEKELMAYTARKLGDIKGLRVLGGEKRVPVFSFVLDRIHPYDAGMILDKMGIALRTGHHCTQPLMHRLGIDGTMRASYAFYNLPEETDRLVAGLAKVTELLR
jgi:cysteine desulfurase/selenocysteine lyase